MDSGRHPWDEIDHQLANWKFARAEAHIRKEFEQRKARIYSQRLKYGNTASEDLVNLEIEYANRLSQAFYQICREVWEKQGRKVRPQFLRAILAQLILPVIETRKASSWETLQLQAERTKMPEALLFGWRSQLTRAMAELEHDWKQRIEIEARELEYSEKTSRQGRPVGPQNATIALIAFIKSRNPQITQRELCAKLDAANDRGKENAPLPASWQERSWVSAFRNPHLKPRVKAYLSRAGHPGSPRRLSAKG